MRDLPITADETAILTIGYEKADLAV